MKKIKYIIVPALMGIIMASCNSEPKGPTQAELDSQVEAKVKTATDQLKSDCDNRIMDAARANADSIMNVAKPQGKTTASAPTSKTKTTTSTTATTATTSKTTTTASTTVPGGGLRTQSDNAKANDKKAVEGGGLRSQSDAAKAKDSKAVEGGGLRSQSDKKIEKK